ncbi:hypothetical protein Btru_021306 [Bulinus truncatus]|nr:hypothetical protein Btru_021306 [Bulinus truncatus]
MRIMSYFLFVCVFNWLAARGVCVLKNHSVSSLREAKVRLRSDLLSHRSVKVGPVDQNNIVKLNFSFYCFQVLMGEDVEQSFTSYNYIEMSWIDTDLRWDPEDYGGLRNASLPYDEMWHPEVMLTNSADKDFAIIKPVHNNLLVNSDGLVALHTQAFLKSTCSLDLTFYPFDIQECDFRFIPFFEDSHLEIMEVYMKAISNPFLLQGEWSILSREISKFVYVDDYLYLPGIQAKVHLRRNPVFYVMSILGPLVVTSAMTSFVFCIPPDSGDRVAFLVTIFVSNALFLNFIASGVSGATTETMPRSFTLSNLPRLAIFLIGVILESFLALLATLYVLWKYNKERQEAMTAKTAPSYERNETRAHQEDIRQGHLEESLDEPVATGSVGKIRSFLGDLLRKNTSVVRPLQNDVTMHRARRDVRVMRRRHVTSRELDVIFFILYHAINVPFYLSLFRY